LITSIRNKIVGEKSVQKAEEKPEKKQ